MAPIAHPISSGVRERRNKKDSRITPSSRILRSHTKSKCKPSETVKRYHNCYCCQELGDHRKRNSTAQKPVTHSTTIDASGSSHPKIEKPMGTLQKQEKVLMENALNNNSWMNYRIRVKFPVLKIKKRWILMNEDYTCSPMEKENVLIDDDWKN